MKSKEIEITLRTGNCPAESNLIGKAVVVWDIITQENINKHNIYEIVNIITTFKILSGKSVVPSISFTWEKWLYWNIKRAIYL